MLDCFLNHVMLNVHYYLLGKNQPIHVIRFCVNLIDCKLLRTNGVVYEHVCDGIIV